MPKPPTQNITEPQSAPSARPKQTENNRLLDVRGIESGTSTGPAIADQHRSQATTDQSGSSPIHASIRGHPKSVGSDLPRITRSLSDAQSNVPTYMRATRSTSNRTVAPLGSSTIVSKRGAPAPRPSRRTSGAGTPLAELHADATSHTIAPALPISRAHRTLASHAVLRGVVTPPRATTPASTQPRRILSATKAARPSPQPNLSSKLIIPSRRAPDQPTATPAHHAPSASSMARARRRSTPANTSERASRTSMTRQSVDGGSLIPTPSSSPRNEGPTKRMAITSAKTTQRSDPSNAPTPGTTSTIEQESTAGPILSVSSPNTSLVPLIYGRRAIHSITSGVEAKATHRPVNASTRISRSDRYFAPSSLRPSPNQATSVLTPLSSASVREASKRGSSSSLPSIGFFSKDSKFNAGRDIMSGNISQQGDGNINAEAENIHIHLGSPSDEHKIALSHISDKLWSYIVDDAVLSKGTHGDPPVCYQGTRGDLLKRTLSWVAADSPERSEESNLSARAKCIVGAPGAGKSTIMNTLIVDLLSQAASRSPGLIAAHYCISRRLSTTTDGSKVLPTITLQLAQQNAGVAKRVSQLLRTALHTGVMTMQTLEHIFLEAIIIYDHTVFVIIDALDEASQPAYLAVMLSRIIHSSPPNLRLLLATRNEHGVLQSLGAALIPRITHEIPTEQSIDEVGGYITRRLKAGVKEMFGESPTWHFWPDDSQLRSLSDRAGGLFIWARTAVDYILFKIQRRGLADRDRWIEDVGALGLADVNNLYLFILQNQLEAEEDDNHREDEDMIQAGMTAVFGFIVVAEHPLPLYALVGLLNLHGFDVSHFIRLARSILVPGTDPITGSTIPQMHKTFFDFITSERASAFRIDTKHHHCQAADRCFAVMASKLTFNIAGLRSSFSAHGDLGKVARNLPKDLTYASALWWYHLDQAGANQLPSDITHIRAFLEAKLLFWLEIVVLLNQTKEARNWLPNLGERLAHRQNISDAGQLDLTGFIRDAATFMVKFERCIGFSIPHIYISLLSFSAGQSLVANHYRKRSATTVIPHPSGIPPEWDSWDTSPKMAHGGSVYSLSFSPCGRRLATGYSDQAIRVWDVETEVCVVGPLKGHRDEINSVCFSPSGLLIASGSDDDTICVWDPETSKCVLSPLTGHTGRVWSVSFSPDSTNISSGSGDGMVRIWDVRTGSCVLGPLEGHTKDVYFVSYSPDGSCIASGSDDTTIRLWDAQTGKSIGGPLAGHRGCISSLAFHPDGQRLVSGSHDKTLRIWDMKERTCTHGPLTGHNDEVWSVYFSPDGRYIASGSSDCTIRIWDAETAVCVAGPFGGASSGVSSVAFSPDGKYLAVGSWDGTIRLWGFSALLSGLLRDPASEHEGSTRMKITDHTVHRDVQTLIPDGNWTLGTNGEHLFWAPKPYSSAIWRPSTVRILGRPCMIKPDLSNLVTGEEWLSCFPNS